MSRFANPAATDILTLPGGCQCDGSPHASDWLRLRTELGAEDAAKVARGGSVVALLTLTVEWNLLDVDGKLAPIDRDHCARLFAENFDPLNDWIEAHVKIGSLPNESAARSQRPSRASGFPTPTPPRAA